MNSFHQVQNASACVFQFSNGKRIYSLSSNPNASEPAGTIPSNGRVPHQPDAPHTVLNRNGIRTAHSHHARSNHRHRYGRLRKVTVGYGKIFLRSRRENLTVPKSQTPRF